MDTQHEYRQGVVDERLVDDLMRGVGDIHRALDQGVASPLDAERLILRLIDEAPVETRQALLDRLQRSESYLDRFCAVWYEREHSRD